jgi:hypothetical protein
VIRQLSRVSDCAIGMSSADNAECELRNWR